MKIFKSANSISLVLTIFVLAFIGGGWSCGKQNTRELIATAAKQQLAALKVESRTATGIRILAETAATDEELAAIDSGFNVGDEKAAAYNLQTLPRSEYTVLLIPTVTETNSNGDYAPAFAVPMNCRAVVADAYCGSDYDKGVYTVAGKVVDENLHYVWAAEQVLPQQGATPFILLARSKNFNADYVRRATSYGYEHETLRRSDYPRFLATVTAPHPILQLPNGE